MSIKERDFRWKMMSSILDITDLNFQKDYRRWCSAVTEKYTRIYLSKIGAGYLSLIA